MEGIRSLFVYQFMHGIVCTVSDTHTHTVKAGLQYDARPT